MAMKSIAIKVGIAQYHPEPLADWNTYSQKITEIIITAKKQDVQLVLLPEYAGLELTAMFSGSFNEKIQSLQSLLPDYLKLYQQLAKTHQIYLQPGTILVETTLGHYVNRAYLFNPKGQFGHQDKIHLTKGEQQIGYIISGEELVIFNTTFGKISIAICYDSEFPSLVHQAVQQGAQLILVPSCTDTLAGYHRVHLSCRARALENQCYVMQACLVGDVANNEFIDINIGQSGVFTPVDIGFPDDGIKALAAMNTAELLTAELNFAAIEQVRKNGQVANYHDMVTTNTQPPLKLGSITL